MGAQLKSRDSEAMIAAGIYQHYKGGLYEVLSVARHSETKEELVVYRSLKDGLLWVRPYRMFAQNVFLDGAWRPRFERVTNGAGSQPGVP